MDEIRVLTNPEHPNESMVLWKCSECPGMTVIPVHKFQGEHAVDAARKAIQEEYVDKHVHYTYEEDEEEESL